ncbi:hypothetical protein [Bordetella tumbae]|uniref:hypothetical protein n=1 Tax=Bordetella tumbae TaxID=1649139 RepID=UPI0039EE376B
MSIHVSPSLDQDQLICKPISFYELVELMTYGRSPFNPLASIRFASLRSAIINKKVMADMAATSISSFPNRTSVQASAASSAIGYQSWDLLEHELSIDWGGDDAFAPPIYIVSTIRALSESLFLSAGMEAFLNRTSRFAGAPGQRRSVRSTVMPVSDDGTLTVTLWSRNHTVEDDQHSVLRLPVDLRTLLTSVLVSPKVPTRFFELVSDLVQRISRARVSHANWSITSAAVRTETRPRNMSHMSID